MAILSPSTPYIIELPILPPMLAPFPVATVAPMALLSLFVSFLLYLA